jgi:hypothetical protein
MGGNGSKEEETLPKTTKKRQREPGDFVCDPSNQELSDYSVKIYNFVPRSFTIDQKEQHEPIKTMKWKTICVSNSDRRMTDDDGFSGWHKYNLDDVTDYESGLNHYDHEQRLRDALASRVIAIYYLKYDAKTKSKRPGLVSGLGSGHCDGHWTDIEGLMIHTNVPQKCKIVIPDNQGEWTFAVMARDTRQGYDVWYVLIVWHLNNATVRNIGGRWKNHTVVRVFLSVGGRNNVLPNDVWGNNPLERELYSNCVRYLQQYRAILLDQFSGGLKLTIDQFHINDFWDLRTRTYHQKFGETIEPTIVTRLLNDNVVVEEKVNEKDEEISSALPRQMKTRQKSPQCDPKKCHARLYCFHPQIEKVKDQSIEIETVDIPQCCENNTFVETVVENEMLRDVPEYQTHMWQQFARKVIANYYRKSDDAKKPGQQHWTDVEGLLVYAGMTPRCDHLIILPGQFQSTNQSTLQKWILAVMARDTMSGYDVWYTLACRDLNGLQTAELGIFLSTNNDTKLPPDMWNNEKLRVDLYTRCLEHYRLYVSILKYQMSGSPPHGWHKILINGFWNTTAKQQRLFPLSNEFTRLLLFHTAAYYDDYGKTQYGVMLRGKTSMENYIADSRRR